MTDDMIQPSAPDVGRILTDTADQHRLTADLLDSLANDLLNGPGLSPCVIETIRTHWRRIHDTRDLDRSVYQTGRPPDPRAAAFDLLGFTDRERAVYTAALDNDCPVCGAQPGHLCTTSYDNPARTPHGQRLADPEHRPRTPEEAEEARLAQLRDSYTEEVVHRPCPRCDVPAGYFCTTDTGAATTPHAARRHENGITPTCGARTASGTPCRAPVHRDGRRCHQHTGQPATP